MEICLYYVPLKGCFLCLCLSAYLIYFGREVRVEQHFTPNRVEGKDLYPLFFSSGNTKLKNGIIF